METDLAAGKPDAVQFAQATRHIARDRPEMLFTHHKVNGQIALARFAQAPVRQQLQAGQLTRAKLPGVGDITPGVFRVDHFLTTLLRHATLVQRGRQPAGGFRLFHQLSGNRQQVKHICRRVFQLTLGKRARQPVGTGFAFVQRQARILLHHSGKAPRQRTAAECREDLRINQRLWHDAKGIQKDFQIFTARVQVFRYRSIEQQVTHRRPVGNAERVDQRDVLTVVHLNQTQLRIVRPGTDKLGIQGNGGKVARHFAQRSQLVVGGDHLVIQIGFSFVCAHKKRRLNRRLGD